MSYHHILLVSDLKDDADIVAQKARAIHARQPDSALSVLHIVKDNMTGFGYEMVINSPAYDMLDIKRIRDGHAALAEFISRNELAPQNADVNIALTSADGIQSYINDNEVDLVIIGRHDRRGFSNWLNKGTVDELLPTIDCDLLIIRLADT